MLKSKPSEQAPQVIKKQRDSNIELYRIVLMLMIIAHHYVVNSGIVQLWDFQHITGNMIFTEFFGLGGKIGINCFLLITGYFMCMQEFKLSKLIKLYLQVKIYAFGIALIFWVSGYELFSFKEGFKVFFDIAYEMNNGFVTAFLALYVITPFLNILIHHMERWRHLLLISVLVSIYTHEC